MPSLSIGPIQLRDVTLETWLLKFDKNGKCDSPEHLAALLARLKDDPELPIILFSHGWNNEYGDATGWYRTFLQLLQAQLNRTPVKRSPLFVGVIWPSTWLSFNTGPSMAASDDSKRQFMLELVDALPIEKKQRLQSLLTADQLPKGQASKLADLVASALSAQLAGGNTDGVEASSPDSAAMLEAMLEFQPATAPAPAQGNELGEGGLHSNVSNSVAAAGGLGYLDPRWALRIASVYTMKDRAGTVGAKGVSSLIKDILTQTTAPLHLVGHSYGAKVVLSAVAAQELPEKVQSILLLQPAISHLCFAKVIPGRAGSGGYYNVPDRVIQPILTTYSGHDFVLHEVFHRALRRAGDLGDLRISGQATRAGNPPSVYAALGGYGPRGVAAKLIEPLPNPGTTLDLSIGERVIGLDGTMDNLVREHGDVVTPHTAWLLYSQLLE